MQRFSTICHWLVWTSLILLFLSCKSPPKYNVTDKGLQWKLLSFADNEQSLDSAEQYFVEVLVTPLHRSDTLAYVYDQFVKRGGDPLRDFLQSRSVGDSLEMVTALRDTLNTDLPYQDTLIYHLRIDRMRTQRQLEDSRLQELVGLDSLMRIDTVASAYREIGGAYFRTILKGDTTAVRRGKEIVIHYQGRNLAGKVFDDSRRMAAPLRFVYGNEDQVLKGLEIAMSQMHLHEKAEVILPSWLAFGSSGSADGRVAPYTTVVYQIEVLELAKD
ncbi:FKBP-type peptidyl-prolyl cis-trans isomerase [Cryomorphaceae bacterium 1068]|nr:FKBP-type peptidyl-prolyl cis-trans isomerase [Cryomorphaceae bacterium 1068]